MLKVIIIITLRSWHLVFFVSPPLCSLDSVKKRRRDETAVN